MNVLKKKLALALTLTLCVLAFSAPLVLAETVTEQDQSTSAVSPETTPSTDTTVVSDPADAQAPADSQVTGETGSVVDPTDATETDADGNSAGTETDDEDIPPVLDENGEVVSPGTLPDSPFYWVTTLIEKLQVALTFDPAKKTAVLEDQALERIAEAGALIEKGETEQAEGTLQAYSDKIAEAQAFLETLTGTDSEARQQLETALSQTHAQNVQTLGGLIDKLPPQAAQKVALNVVRSMEKSIAKMDKKEQQKLAKDLKKVTDGLEESDLTEEDQAALEDLNQTLDQAADESEETAATAVASDTTLSTMAVAASTDPAIEGSQPKRQASVQNGDNNEIKKSHAKAELELTEEQEQEQNIERKAVKNDQPKIEPQKGSEDESVEDDSIEEAKVQEPRVQEPRVQEPKPQAQQEAKLKEPQEDEEKGNAPDSDSSTKRETSGATAGKASSGHDKGGNSGGKGK